MDQHVVDSIRLHRLEVVHVLNKNQRVDVKNNGRFIEIGALVRISNLCVCEMKWKSELLNAI